MIEPNETLRLSTERQDEKYPDVAKVGKEGYLGMRYPHMVGKWYGFCCPGCHGCSGMPVTNGHPRPIDAHLDRLEWQGKPPVGPVRVVK